MASDEFQRGEHAGQEYLDAVVALEPERKRAEAERLARLDSEAKARREAARDG